MATASGRVLYAFPSLATGTAAGDAQTFDSITLTVGETTSRTFRSVAVRITSRDNATTAASITSWRIEAKLGSADWADLTNITATIGNSNEAQTVSLTASATSYFTSNFGTGATQTCQIRLTIGGMTTINSTCELDISYEFDDANDTRTKTVQIPLDTTVGHVPGTLTEIGTNQIPDLDDFCLEASKSFKNIFFRISFIENAGVANDRQIGMQIDSETEVLSGSMLANMGTNIRSHYVFVQNSLTTSAAHAFKLRCTVSNGLGHPSIVLVATYTYDESDTTSTTQSVELPLGCETGDSYMTYDSTRQSTLVASLNVQEPGTIALLQSGVVLGYTSDFMSGPKVTCGTQTQRDYTQDAGSVGTNMVSQRFDSGALAGGTANTLARGANTIAIKVFHSSSTKRSSWLTGVAYINYSSTKPTGGSHLANHTISQIVQASTNAGLSHDTAQVGVYIPETSYYLNGLGLLVENFIGPLGNASMSIRGEFLSGEGGSHQWFTVVAPGVPATENGLFVAWVSFKRFFYRWASDLDSFRANPEGSRLFQSQFIGNLSTNALNVYGFTYLCTYHAITKAITGTVSGYSGDGSGITVEVHPTTGTRERVASATTAAGGGYTAYVYDDTLTHFAHARVDATHCGRSDNGS